MNYRQCRMSRGNTVHTAWIPARYAKVNKVIRLKIDGVWIDGYVVEEVFGAATEKQIKLLSSTHKHHREATDI